MIIITTNIQYIYLQFSLLYIIPLKYYTLPPPVIYTLIHSNVPFPYTNISFRLLVIIMTTYLCICMVYNYIISIYYNVCIRLYISQPSSHASCLTTALVSTTYIQTNNNNIHILIYTQYITTSKT